LRGAGDNPYDNEWTRRIYKNCKSVGPRLYCGGPTYLNSNTTLGYHCCFNGCQILGLGNVKIGRYFHSGTELLIIAQNHNYDGGEHIPYSPDDYVYKDIEIGDFVWVGGRVMIMPGVKIGEGAIIGGGSVVRGEVPPYAIAFGNPAKVVKYRNIEHFEKLKKLEKFH